jgi:hypothetical protein
MVMSCLTCDKACEPMGQGVTRGSKWVLRMTASAGTVKGLAVQAIPAAAQAGLLQDVLLKHAVCSPGTHWWAEALHKCAVWPPHPACRTNMASHCVVHSGVHSVYPMVPQACSMHDPHQTPLQKLTACLQVHAQVSWKPLDLLEGLGCWSCLCTFS